MDADTHRLTPFPDRTVMVVAGEDFELAHVRSRPGLRVVKVANGPGPRLAGAGMEAVPERVDVVVSSGLCGALDAGLQVGDIFVANSVNGEPVELPRCAGKYSQGPLVSVDRVAGRAEERRALAETGAWAVDMESAAVLKRARALGVPFYCVRAVSDGADEDWALDLNAARDGSGKIRVAHILGQAARRPFQVVPELLRLRRNAAKAAQGLGVFFANCEF